MALLFWSSSAVFVNVLFWIFPEKDFDGGIIKVEIATRVQKSFDKGGRGGRGGGDRGKNLVLF